MGRATATITVKGRAAEAEALWYDRHRWASWVDGFGHVLLLEGDWPEVGARLVWDSPPGGQFAPSPPAGGEPETPPPPKNKKKDRHFLTPLVDLLFVRRAMADSL